MPYCLSSFRRYAVFLVALLAMVWGSCQAQQSLRHTLGLQAPPALYKGKAAAPTACATEQQQATVTAQPQVARHAEPPLLFRKTTVLFPPAARRFPLARQGIAAAAAPPFYILFKRWKLHV